MHNGLRTARLVTIVCIVALMVSLVPRGGWPILAFGGAMVLAAPVLMVGARFGNRGLIVAAPISAVLVLGATVGVDPAYVAHHPESVVVPLALVIMTAALTGASEVVEIGDLDPFEPPIHALGQFVREAPTA